MNYCERHSCCQTLYIWEGLYKVVNEYLDGITIQDILDRNGTVNGNYVI